MSLQESTDERIVELVKFITENNTPSDFSLNYIEYTHPKYHIRLTKFDNGMYIVTFNSSRVKEEKSLLQGFSGFYVLNGVINKIHNKKIEDHFNELKTLE